MQPLRGWTDAEWEQATGRLAGRGLASADGSETPDGVVLRASIERTTDEAAARPWARLGPAFTARLTSALAPIALACADELPFPNPVGIPVPARAPAGNLARGARTGRARR